MKNHCSSDCLPAAPEVREMGFSLPVSLPMRRQIAVRLMHSQEMVPLLAVMGRCDADEMNLPSSCELIVNSVGNTSSRE
jgi:hypothetical protein